MTRKCMVEGCPDKYAQSPGSAMFRFPKDLVLQRIWIIRTGSNNLLHVILGGGICSYHFSEKNFKAIDRKSNKDALCHYALPDVNLPEIQTSGQDFSYAVVSTLINELQDREILTKKTAGLEEQNGKLEKKVKIIEKQLNEINQKNTALQEQVTTIELIEATRKKNETKNFEKAFYARTTEVFSHIFTKRQIDLLIQNGHFKHWKDEDMAKAIAIYNSSSSCYVYLRDKLHYPLPSKRSVLRWLSKIKVSPGIIFPVLRVIKEEFLNFTNMQRQAVLCFDEVSIDSRVSLEEKNQRILGSYKNMLGVYVRGLFYEWKQLVYFGFDVRITKDLIFEIIKALNEAGVNIVGMVSDMHSINRRVWKELGIDINNDIFSFSHPITNDEVWVFADFVHLIKLLRNHFLDYVIKLGEEFGFTTVSRKLIEAVIESQKDDLKLTFNLSMRHLNMNKRERMDARSAFQLFSRKTATAIKMLFPDEKNASEFFTLVNDVCDIFNSHTKILRPNPFQCPFGAEIEKQISTLQKFETTIMELRFQGGRTSIKPFQKGFKLSIRSLIGLYEQMKKPPVNAKYIMTSHINQDYVESGFSVFRGIGGYNDLPLPSDAIFRVKAMIVSWNLRSPRTTGIHMENSSSFLSSDRLTLMMKSNENEILEEEIVNPDSDYWRSMFFEIDPYQAVEIPLLTEMSLQEKGKFGGTEYLAGYVARKFMNEFPEMKAVPPTNRIGWVEMLSTSNLISPSDWWLGTFLKFEQYFSAFHNSKYTNQLNLNRKPWVINQLTTYLSLKFPNIPEKAIRFYVKVRTKIRIEAINKKIVIIRKQRRSQAFMNSMIAEQQLLNNEIEEEHEDAEDAEIETNASNLDENVSVQDEFEIALEDTLEYSPRDFDIFDETEVYQAMQD